MKKTYRYIGDVATLAVDRETCVGCGMCTQVCPQAVLTLVDRKVEIVDRDGCMECGACSTNCPVEAIAVTPGVGCAALIISRWLNRIGIHSSGCC